MLNGNPCDDCEHLRTERETGAGYCDVCDGGEFTCELARACEGLGEFGGRVSRLLRDIEDDDDRSALIDGVCSLLEETCAEHGVTFNSDLFCRWCGDDKEER